MGSPGSVVAAPWVDERQRLSRATGHRPWISTCAGELRVAPGRPGGRDPAAGAGASQSARGTSLDRAPDRGTVVLVLLAVAARPGPVPCGARQLILSLFAVLVLANTTAATRLVVLVLRSTPKGEAPPTVTQLLVAAAIVLATNVVTFGLLYWQIDSGGPRGRLSRAVPYPDFQFPQTCTEGLAPPNGSPVPRPSVRGIHQRGCVQSHRHASTHPPRQGTHGDPVDDLPGRPRRRSLPGHQHPAGLNDPGTEADQPAEPQPLDHGREPL